jgi:alkanesulfonate monooxygenase SsuD/methylene tetrahydromethanopterin reductase-like flavin-dependent oxidoreductase (luciferase family)
MTDYGHDLLFGANLIPSSEHPDTVVALAKLAEQTGLDLVTFQDHPYQPTFLDTWTLLSYVAARTSTIRLAGNVHPLPLRPPAMLAQSAASLDLLSGGRFELALGAGGFQDAIAAMGGQRHAPGKAVAAVEEAIAIIRAAWDPPGEVFFEGEHYRVTGMRRGPRPAHDVGVWVGGYKPRMLELIGRAADGWLPSLPHLGELDALGRGNAVIDEAAERTGRKPSDIRRLLNLGEELPAEQLAEVALVHGTSGFTLRSASRARRPAGSRRPAPHRRPERQARSARRTGSARPAA